MKLLKIAIVSASALTTVIGCSSQREGQSEINYFSGKTMDRNAAGPQQHTVRLSLETSPGTQKFYCSGVLVAPTIVLTAAHCVVRMDEIRGGVSGAFLPSSIKVVLPGGVETEAKETHFPDNFDLYSSFAYGVDIGFLVLKEAAPLANVANVASEKDVDNWLSKSVPPLVLKGVGFGQTQNNSGSAGSLNSLDVPYIDDFGPLKDPVSFEVLSRNALGSKGKALEFMAGFSDRIACPGDSGGGVFLEASPGAWSLMGIASRTIGSRFVAGDNCSVGRLTAVYSYAFAGARFIEGITKIKILK